VLFFADEGVVPISKQEVNASLEDEGNQQELRNQGGNQTSSELVNYRAPHVSLNAADEDSFFIGF
jgi:hypothetical protein